MMKQYNRKKNIIESTSDNSQEKKNMNKNWEEKEMEIDETKKLDAAKYIEEISALKSENKKLKEEIRMLSEKLSLEQIFIKDGFLYDNLMKDGSYEVTVNADGTEALFNLSPRGDFESKDGWMNITKFLAKHTLDVKEFKHCKAVEGPMIVFDDCTQSGMSELFG